MKYPKPSPSGGQLIREVMGTFRALGGNRKLPITSDILISFSGGADSTALAHLLVHYGRRVIDRKKIRLLHINHNWRGEESNDDEAFVRQCADRWDVPLHVIKLPPMEVATESESWEDRARRQRKEIYTDFMSQGLGALVLTAHHADDLAETLIWRLFTGASKTHGGGILFETQKEIRPFLRTRKRLLEAYLVEEGQGWREDSTNYSSRFLRARLRAELMPVIEKLFPRAVEHLGTIGLSAQKKNQTSEKKQLFRNWVEAPRFLFQRAGIFPRRAHWEKLQEFFDRSDDDLSFDGREMHLPGGWRLIEGGESGREKRSDSSDSKRWTLERIHPVPQENRGSDLPEPNPSDRK